MSIEAMKQALEALENLQGLCSEEGNFIEQLTIWTPEAMYALRTAIEQADKQEPVACRTRCELCIKRGYIFCANAAKTTPITTPPAAQRQWVGLTDSQRKEIERQSVYVDGAIRMTEAKLKEKNT
jgi:hypothetical protein